MEPDVKSCMTGQPVSIEPEASALAALDLMINHAIRHLPVVDQRGDVCGVLSFDDLRAALPIALSLHVPLSVDERNSLPDVAVGEVMTYAPATIGSNDPLDEAAQLMIEGRFGCLPVVDERGRLDGILTETDLLLALVTTLWTGKHGAPPAERVSLATALENERAHLASRLEAGRLTGEFAGLASKRLRSIEQALERELRGELSVCERCGERIPEARLRALPGTSLCIRCARESPAVG